MMHQNGPNKAQKYRTSSHVPTYHPNHNGGYPKPGECNNTSNFNRAPPKFNNDNFANNTNTAQ